MQSIADRLKDATTRNAVDSPGANVASDLDAILEMDFSKDDALRSKIIVVVNMLSKKTKMATLIEKCNQVKNKCQLVIKGENQQPVAKPRVSEEFLAMRKRFRDAFAAELVKSESTDSIKLALQIEEAMSELPDYEEKYRLLIGALRSKEIENEYHIMQKLVSGEMSPSEFVRLNSSDLLTEAQKRKQKQMITEAYRDIMVPGRIEKVEDGVFKCPRCKCSKCSSYQLQTRGADEPMTNFVTCTQCGHGWRC